MLTRAIVRSVPRSFVNGITSAGLGPPDVALAAAQHRAYRDALRACGLDVVELPADERFPDAPFVEDTAVVVPGGVVATRPGAPSRAGETALIRPSLEASFARVHEIVAPGTVDGGDVCQAGTHFFIGRSERTDDDGAAQLRRIVTGLGASASIVDIRGIPGLLHLKSGLSYLGDDRFVVVEELADRREFRQTTPIVVHPEERYAANCVVLGRSVLVPAGRPRLAAALELAGFRPVLLALSEFEKMDGGPSCLSIRF